MSGPTIDFWQDNFEAGTTPWDRGAPGPQLTTWLGTEIDVGQRVLVPGCGSGWDVAALAAFGAKVVGIDYAPAAVARTRDLLIEHGLSAQVIKADVLHWSPSQAVDAVYEQTCLCALHPDHWTTYAASLHRWIRPGGKLLAMFMQKARPQAAAGFVEGPPFHCDINAMRALFRSECWIWPKPPYPGTSHPSGAYELAVILERR
jgi:methyl halide transferase